MEVSGQLGRANFRKHTEGQGDDIIVIAIEIDADAVGGHHQQL